MGRAENDYTLRDQRPRLRTHDAVWQAEVVAVNTLTHSIADLRRAFGDDARHPRFIETIPKCGYRVIAPVSGVEALGPVGAGGPLFKLVASGREYVLHEGSNIIGRSEAADVRVGSEQASREHARNTVSCDRVVIENLGSKNGTYLRDERFRAAPICGTATRSESAAGWQCCGDGRTLTEEAGEDC